jgi:hypothetical protein
MRVRRRITYSKSSNGSGGKSGVWKVNAAEIAQGMQVMSVDIFCFIGNVISPYFSFGGK